MRLGKRRWAQASASRLGRLGRWLAWQADQQAYHDWHVRAGLLVVAGLEQVCLAGRRARRRQGWLAARVVGRLCVRGGSSGGAAGERRPRPAAGVRRLDRCSLWRRAVERGRMQQSDRCEATGNSNDQQCVLKQTSSSWFRYCQFSRTARRSNVACF